MDEYKENENEVKKNVNKLNKNDQDINTNTEKFTEIVNNLVSSSDSEQKNYLISLSSYLKTNSVVMNDERILNTLEETLFSLLTSASDQEIIDSILKCILNISAQKPPLSSIVQSKKFIEILVSMMNEGISKAAKCIYNILLSGDETSTDIINDLIDINLLQSQVFEQEPDNAQPYLLIIRELMKINNYGKDEINKIIHEMPTLLNEEKTSKIALSLLHVILEKQDFDAEEIPEEIHTILNEIIGSSMHQHAGIALNCIELLYSKIPIAKGYDPERVFSNFFDSVNEYNMDKSITVFTNILTKNEDVLHSFASNENIGKLIELMDDKSAKTKENICLLLALIIDSLGTTEIMDLSEFLIPILINFCSIISQNNEVSTKKLLHSFYKIVSSVTEREAFIEELCDNIDIDEILEICELQSPEVYSLLKPLFEG